MRSQKTEEERIERIIRSLLKLPENKRCINCNLLGPQYVCTTFSTFVCTNCSGIHREFTHRVKSVSMAKFSPEEVSALQAGGNERANQIYLKEWDPLRNSKPDPSNIQKLREFIKYVYVERRYTGESGTSNLSRVRLSEKEPNASKRSSSFRLEFRTPSSSPGPYPRSSDDKNLRYLYDESRSPRYAQKYSRNGGHIRSPIQIEVVDDRYKDDERRNRRLANIEAKLKKTSSDDLKKVETVAAPSAEVSKEKAQPLQIKPAGGKGSVEEKPSKQNNNDNPETQPPPPPIAQQSNENNWAIFEASTEDNVPKTPPNTSTSNPSTGKPPSAKNPIDLLLSELSGPMTPVTGGISPVPSSANNDQTTTTIQNAIDWDFPPTSAGKTTASSNNTNNTSVWPCTSTPATEPAQPSNEVPPHTEVSHQHNPSSMQYLPSASVAFSSTAQPTNSPVIDVASNNKPSVTPSEKDPSWSFTELPSQTTSKPTQETKSDVGLQPSKVETKASGRQEIPENLFAPSYLSRPAPLPNWQNVQPSGMGYGLQYYHNAVPPSALSNSPMSTNPFELTDVRNITHVSSLPSMASVPGAPQALSSPRTALMHTASLGSLVSQSPSYTSPVMGMYFDQVDNKEQPNRPQRVESFNGDITSFGSIDPLQHSNRSFQTCKSSISISNTRANPFD